MCSTKQRNDVYFGLKITEEEGWLLTYETT